MPIYLIINKKEELTPEEIAIGEQNIRDEIHCIVADAEQGRWEDVKMTLSYIDKYLIEPAHNLTTTYNENDLKLMVHYSFIVTKNFLDQKDNIYYIPIELFPFIKIN